MSGSSKERASVAVAASNALKQVLKRLKIDKGAASPSKSPSPGISAAPREGVSKGAQPPRHTHTSMAGGSYRVAGKEDRQQLMDAYCAALDAGRMDLYMVEQPDPGAMPLLVDLDFRLPQGESERRYDAETVTDFLKGYVRCACKYVESDMYAWYVLEKPAPRPKDGSFVYKDGLHLVCPGIVTSAAVQRAIRTDFLADPYNEGFFEAQGTTSAEEVYDVTVLGTNAWMMYGSRKAKDDPSPWMATRVIEVTVGDEGSKGGGKAIRIESRPVTTDTTADGKKSTLARLLSVHRESTDATPLTAAVADIDFVGVGAAPKARPKARPRARTAMTAPPPEGGERGVEVVVSDEDSREACELVRQLSIDRSDTYMEWMKVGWSLRNTAGASSDPAGSSAVLLAAWDDFSRRSAKYVAGEPARLWGEMEVREPGQDGRGLGLWALRAWARKDTGREDAFGVVTTDVLEDVRMCNGSHNDVARIAHRLLEGRYVCASADGKVWYGVGAGGLWAIDEGAISVRHELSTTVREHFVAALNRLLTEACEDDVRSGSAVSSSRGGRRRGDGCGRGEVREATDKLLGIAFKLQDAGFKDGVMKEMREYFFDATFMRRLDADPNLLGFKNGVFDLRQRRFRVAEPEDCVSLSTGCEWKEDADDEEAAEARRKVDRYWETLHPDPEQRRYVMATIARQLYGDHGQELFHIHAGHRASAENGKSKFFDVLERCLGGYVRKFGVEMLTAKQRIEPGKPMPEFEPWRGVRVLYCTEPNHDDVLNSGILKDLTGGEAVMYRLLFSNVVQQFRPQFKLHIMCNDAPTVDGSDSGVKRRIRMVEWISRFVDADQADATQHMYVRDTGLVEGFKSSDAMRLAFVKSLLRVYDHEWTFAMPEVVRASSQVYLQENDAVHKFVAERVRRQAGAWFTLKQAKDEFKGSEHFNGKLKTLKTDLEKALGTKCYEQKRIDGPKEINVFEGFEITSSACAADEL